MGRWKHCAKYILLAIFLIRLSLGLSSFSIAQTQKHTPHWTERTERALEHITHYTLRVGCTFLNIIGALGEATSHTYHRTNPEMQRINCS